MGREKGNGFLKFLTNLFGYDPTQLVHEDPETDFLAALADAKKGMTGEEVSGIFEGYAIQKDLGNWLENLIVGGLQNASKKPMEPSLVGGPQTQTKPKAKGSMHNPRTRDDD